MDHGASINAKTVFGDTAVHYAALTGTLESMKFLIEEGIELKKSEMKPDAEEKAYKYRLPKVRNGSLIHNH